MTLYGRDRPIIDESQSSELTRDGAYAGELEKWRFGRMYVSLVPYIFDPEDEDSLADHFSGDDPPDWVTDLVWRIDVSGRNPDDAFFDWFRACAEASRGIIYDPYKDAYDERIVSFEAPSETWLAELMIAATRPWNYEIDSSASLDSLQAAGLRVSWEAMQYLYLGLDGQPGEIVFTLSGPNRGPRDPRALLRITTHPDPEIDRLARDPDGVGALRDLLLRRNEPVAPLLHDLVADSELARARLNYSVATKNELVELWERVMGVEGRVDIARMHGEIRRPRME
ncbi:MAG: hypothetical protein HOV80_23830 [Polyangiaceae bacterium]|nr:hypothetical protein [Polyangiaceae bacterium]